jgi:hypothetical protein
VHSLLASVAVLSENDPRVKRFAEEATPAAGWVRLHHLAPLPNDPALPAELREHGLVTMTDGLAAGLAGGQLKLLLPIGASERPLHTASDGFGEIEWQEMIVPLNRVFDIQFIGPR